MKICLIACLDTKGAECDFLKQQFIQKNHNVIIFDVGVFPSKYKADINLKQIVGEMNNVALATHTTSKSQADIINLICDNATKTIPALIDVNGFDVIIGMGGSNGTLLSKIIMKLFPEKTRKICISTLFPAHIDLNEYAALKIEMVPAIVDLSGLNIITQHILQYVTDLVMHNKPSLTFRSESHSSKNNSAIKFLINHLKDFNIISELQKQANKIIAITMFGNTTICVEACHKKLTELGYQVIIFHATGIGGEIMSFLLEQQCIKAGVLDITTTELADLICGGSMGASAERFYAPTKYDIPHLIAPGCLDMVNFVPIDSIPSKYVGRNFLSWGTHMQLMRTNKEENIAMGEFLAKLANSSKNPVEFVLPMGGFSVLGQAGNKFSDSDADMSLINSIKSLYNNDFVTTINQPINHPQVSDILTRKIHFMIQKSQNQSNQDLSTLSLHYLSLTEANSQQATTPEQISIISQQKPLG